MISREQFVALASGLCITLMYLFTLYPGVPGGDAGELIGAAATGGVPHPPGYPLYVFVTAPFTWLPIFTVAWRANLAAALCGAAAAMCVAWLVQRLTGKWWAGVLTAGAFAFSPTVWLYAISAEVFALNNLIVAIELCLLAMISTSADKTPADRKRIDAFVFASAFVFGLGLSNHHTSLFVNGVIVLAILWRTRARWNSVKRWAMLAGAGAAGLLPYLYLPISAARHGLISWGDTGTMNGFVAHLLRRDYGTFALRNADGAPSMPFGDQLEYFGGDLVTQLSWIGVLFAAWGLWRGLADGKLRFFARTTAAAAIVYLVVLHSLANLPIEQPLIHGVMARFWQMPLLIICIWIGFGIASIPRVPAVALTSVALALAVAQAAIHFPASNHRRDSVVNDYGHWILNSLPPNALVLMRGDLITNTARYLQSAEGVRPDLRLLDQEMLTYRWMTPQIHTLMPDIVVPGEYYGVRAPGTYLLRQLVDANIAKRPVVTCGSIKPGDSSLDGVYRRLPLGLCDRLVPASDTLDLASFLPASDAALPQFLGGISKPLPADSWELVAWNDGWESMHRQALTLLAMGIERQDDPAFLRASAERFDRLIAATAQPAAHYYKNLGITRQHLAASEPASARSAIEAFQAYLRLGPANDPERPAIEQAIQELAAIK